MCILKIRAEIFTRSLIHKINWEVSGMIFYVISNPNFLWHYLANFFAKYRTITSTFASFNNMKTLFHLCMTAWLTFRITRISAFLILLGQPNQLFFYFHGHTFVNEPNRRKQFKTNLAYPNSQKKMFQSLDFIVGNRFKFFWINKPFLQFFRQFNQLLANY